MAETSFLDTRPQEWWYLSTGTPEKAKKDWCEKKTCIVSEVTFSTTAMPAYLQFPDKPTMVILKDLNDDC